jgi:hypothetical protein
MFIFIIMFMFYTDARVDNAAQSESCVQTGGEVDGETNNSHSTHSSTHGTECGVSAGWPPADALTWKNANKRRAARYGPVAVQLTDAHR